MFTQIIANNYSSFARRGRPKDLPRLFFTVFIPIHIYFKMAVKNKADYGKMIKYEQLCCPPREEKGGKAIW